MPFHEKVEVTQSLSLYMIKNILEYKALYIKIYQNKLFLRTINNDNLHYYLIYYNHI